MTRRRSSPLGLELVMSVVLALVVLPLLSHGAPVQEGHAELQRHWEGCYYNFNHYGEGDKIITNEPCLNCTCHNRMLMCYLRVCPFTKPIGHDCVVEKREDQCCPIITCPEVPVNVSYHHNQLTTHEPGTELSTLEKYGCAINDTFYPEGSLLPLNTNKPCELCYCIKNRSSCLIKECTLHIDGCQPVYNKGSCCPVRYNCDHENELLELEDHSTTTTTVRPTTGFVLSSTSSPAVSTDCIHNNEIYADGASITGKNACEHCYCMRGDIVCAVQECEMPTLESGAKTCRALPPAEGECCPSNYVCDDDSAPTEVPIIEDITTTKIHLDLHVSEEDVQLQEHIDDKAVVAETPEKSDIHPDLELGSGEGTITDSSVIDKVTQGAVQTENKYESPTVTTISSIKETTHETTIPSIELDTVISEDKENDSRPASAVPDTTSPSGEMEEMEVSSTTISSSEVSEENAAIEKDITTIRTVVEPSKSDGQKPGLEPDLKSSTISSVEEEEKLSVTDTATSSSVEEKYTPSTTEVVTSSSAEEEGKPTVADTATSISVEEGDKSSATESVTSSSADDEGKPMIFDSATRISVEKEDKSSTTEDVTSSSAEEEGKPTVADTATSISVEEGDKSSATESVTSSSADKEGRPTIVDTATSISVEEEDKSSATESVTSSSADKEGKPTIFDTATSISVEKEDKSSATESVTSSSADKEGRPTIVDTATSISVEEEDKSSATESVTSSSADKEGKPTIFDTATSISVEKEDKSSATESVTSSSADKEGRPTIVDTATSISVEGEDKSSATEAVTNFSAEEEGKPVNADTTTSASVEKEEKPSATEAATSSSAEDEGKPTVFDTATSVSVTEQDKSSATESATSSLAEKEGKPIVADTTTSVSVEGENKLSATETATSSSAEIEGKPVVADTATSVSVEDGDKSSATEAGFSSSSEEEGKPTVGEENKPTSTESKRTESTKEQAKPEDKVPAFDATTIIPVEEKVPSPTNVALVPDLIPETSTQEEESTELSSTPKAYIPPRTSEKDEEEMSTDSEEITKGTKDQASTTISPVYETITEGGDSHIVMPEIGDHTSHDVEEKIKDEHEVSTQTQVHPAVVPSDSEDDKKDGSQEYGDRSTLKPESSIREDDNLQATESEIPAIVEEVTQKASESKPTDAPEDKIEIVTHDSKEESEEKESSSEKETTKYPTEEQDIEKETTATPFETPSTEENTTPSQRKDSVEATSSEEDKSEYRPVHEVIGHTTSTPSSEESSSEEEGEDAEKQPTHVVSDLTTSSPSEINTQVAITEKEQDVKHVEPQDTEKQPGHAIDDSTISSVVKTEAPFIEEEESKSEEKLEPIYVIDDFVTAKPIDSQSEEEGSGASSIAPSKDVSEETSSEEESIKEQPSPGPVDLTTVSPVVEEDLSISSTLSSVSVDTKIPIAAEDVTQKKTEHEDTVYSTTSAPSVSDFVGPTSSEEYTGPVAIDFEESTLKYEEPIEHEPHYGVDSTTVIPIAPESQKPSGEKEISPEQPGDIDYTTSISSLPVSETSFKKDELQPVKTDDTTILPSVVESDIAGTEKDHAKDKTDESILDSTTALPPAEHSDTPSLAEKEQGAPDVTATTTVLPSIVEQPVSASEEEEHKKRPDLEIPESTTVTPSIIDTKKTSATTDEETQTSGGSETESPITFAPTEVSSESSDTYQSSEASGMPVPGIIPPAIPGEGDCLVNERTYKNNDTIPVSNECEISCTCVSSIVVCQRVQCNVPAQPNDCVIDEANTDKCCPQYICGYDSFSDEQRPTPPAEIEDGEIQFTTLPPSQKQPEIPSATELEEPPITVTIPKAELDETTGEEKEKPVTEIHRGTEEGEAATQEPSLSVDSKTTEKSFEIEKASTTTLSIDVEVAATSSEEPSSVEGSAEGPGDEDISTEDQEQLPSVTGKPVIDEHEEPVHAPETFATHKPVFDVDEKTIESEPAATEKSPLDDTKEPVGETLQPLPTSESIPSKAISEDNAEITTQSPSDQEINQRGTDGPVVQEEEIFTKSPYNVSEISTQSTSSSQPIDSELPMTDSSEGMNFTESQEIPETPVESEKESTESKLPSEEATTAVPVVQDTTTIKTIHTDLEGNIQPEEPFESNTIIPEIIYQKPEMPENMSHTKIEEPHPVDTETSRPILSGEDESSDSDTKTVSTDKTSELAATTKAPVTPVNTLGKEPTNIDSHPEIHDTKDERFPTDANIRKEDQPVEQSTEQGPIEDFKLIPSTIAPGLSTAESISDITESVQKLQPTTVVPTIDEQPIAETIPPVEEEKIEQQTSAPSGYKPPLPATDVGKTDLSKEGAVSTDASSTPSIWDDTVTSSLGEDSGELVHPAKPPQTPDENLDIEAPTTVLPGELTPTSSTYGEEIGVPSVESATKVPEKEEDEYITKIPVKADEKHPIYTKLEENIKSDDIAVPTEQSLTSLPDEGDKQSIDKTLLTTESALAESETSHPTSKTEEKEGQKPDGESTHSTTDLPLLEASTPAITEEPSTGYVYQQPSSETSEPTHYKDEATASTQPENEEYTTKQPLVEISKPDLAKDELPTLDKLAPHDETTQQSSEPVSADHTSVHEVEPGTSKPTEVSTPETESSVEEKTEIPSSVTDIAHTDKNIEELMPGTKLDEALSEEKTELPISSTETPDAGKPSEELFPGKRTERPSLIEIPSTEIPLVEPISEKKPDEPLSEEKTESPLLTEKPSTVESGTPVTISVTGVPEEQEQTLAPAVVPEEVPSHTEHGISQEEQSTKEPSAPHLDDQQLVEKVIDATIAPVDISTSSLPTISDVPEEATTTSEEVPKDDSKESIPVEFMTDRGEEPNVFSTQEPHEQEIPKQESLPFTPEETSTSQPKDKEVTITSEKSGGVHEDEITQAPVSEKPVEEVKDKFETDVPKPIVTDVESRPQDEVPLTTTAHPLFPHLDLDQMTPKLPLNATDKPQTESSPTPTTPQPITSAPTTHYQPPNYGHVPPQYSTYPDDEYNEEDETEVFGPGTCRYGGKLFVSAQQIPRDDPCDFCFCFRSDIICLQQSCPPPISGCHEEPINGFCCPRYECPVSMATVLNITTSTTTTSTTLPPHFFHHAYRGAAEKNGCHINGKSYKVGDPIDSASGPCMHCTCGGDGQMKCDPKTCSPEPMLRQMIAVVASRRR